jgi:hypothetical protein
MEVRMMPVQYAFAQEVTLYRRERVVDQHGDGDSGWTVSPHWRRGHWRSQPFGAGRSERNTGCDPFGAGERACSWDRPPTRWRPIGCEDDRTIR